MSAPHLSIGSFLKAYGFKDARAVAELLSMHINSARYLLHGKSLLSHRGARKLEMLGILTYEDAANIVVRQAHDAKRRRPAWTDLSRRSELQKIRIRGASRRAYPVVSCSVCKTKQSVERHHADYNSIEIEPLCRLCHASKHNKEGTWGHGGTRQTNCTMCGKQFQYRQKKAAKVCSAACFAAKMSVNMKARWASGRMRRPSP